MIAGRRQHVVAYEDGAAAENSGVQFHTLPDEDGTISPAGIRWAIEAANHHMPKPSLVCVENTHMAASGMPWHPDDLTAVVHAAGDLPVYMDGARLFNAEVATGVAGCRHVRGNGRRHVLHVERSLRSGRFRARRRGRHDRRGTEFSVTAWVEPCDKPASSPPQVSLLWRRWCDRLADDHARARRLAEAIAASWPDAGCDPEMVRTNIVVFTHSDPSKLLSYLHTEGVLAGTIAPDVVRLVTHNDVDDQGLERALAALKTAL